MILTEPKLKTKKRTIYEPDLEFDEFWEVYPRKDQKQEAIKAWVQTKDIRPDLNTLKRAVNAYTSFKKDGSPRMIAHAATWLRGRQWDDESIKKFITYEKVDKVEPISPERQKHMELESRWRAMMDIGNEKALKLAEEIKQEMDQISIMHDSTQSYRAEPI